MYYEYHIAALHQASLHVMSIIVCRLYWKEVKLFFFFKLLLLKWPSMQPQFICHKFYEEFLVVQICLLCELTEQEGGRDGKKSQQACQFVAKLINLCYVSEFSSCLPHFWDFICEFSLSFAFKNIYFSFYNLLFSQSYPLLFMSARGDGLCSDKSEKSRVVLMLVPWW